MNKKKTAWIKTVKEEGISSNTLLVNGVMFVPKTLDNERYKDVLKWIADGNEIEPFETTEQTIKRETSQAKKALQHFCDQKTQDAKSYINGKMATYEQLERYKEKYEIAKSDDKSSLQLEADLMGLTVDELATLIIQLGDAYTQSLTAFNSKIEAVRVRVGQMIASGDISGANAIMKIAKEFDVSTTDEDIKAIFA